MSLDDTIGLRAKNLLCVVNSDSALSQAVASYYRTKRGLNANQFLELSLPLPSNNQMTPAQYTALSEAINAYVASSGLPVKCLVMMPDIPVSVCWPDLSLTGVDNNLAVRVTTPVATSDVASPYYTLYRAAPQGLTDQAQFLCKGSYAGFWLVSRFDGPATGAGREAIIKGMIDGAVDDGGLNGTLYFDQSVTYSSFDAQLVAAAAIATAHGKTVVLETPASTNRLAFTGAAGFYHGGYTNPPTYVAGQTPYAVGSIGAEMQSGAGIRLDVLNNGYLDMLCAHQIAQGVAGTWGPVGEPYLRSIPDVSIMLTALFAGLTWAESWWLSNPFVLWKQCMVGDPLYRPFPRTRRVFGRVSLAPSVRASLGVAPRVRGRVEVGS